MPKNLMDMTLAEVDADPELQQRAVLLLAPGLIGVAYELGRLRQAVDRATS